MSGSGACITDSENIFPADLIKSFCHCLAYMLATQFLCLTSGVREYKYLQVRAAYGYQDTCRTVQDRSSMSVATSK